MAATPTAPVPAVRRPLSMPVVWYPSTSLTEDECTTLAANAGGIVVHGKSGADMGVRLRKHGYSGWLVLDPAMGKAVAVAPPANLFGVCEWLEREQSAGVTEFLSPGEFVPAGDRATLTRVIAEQATWVAGAPGVGRINLYLDARWLRNAQDVITALRTDADAGMRVALAFGHRADPLAAVGAVKGYVHLLHGLGDVAVLRSDLGAVGGSVHGASWTAIGTGTSTRHFQIPGGKKNTGAPGDKTPSAIMRDLLGFKLGSSLMSLPNNLVPVCHLSCCGGQPLSRFNSEQWSAQVRDHNQVTVNAIVAHLRSMPARRRRTEWKSMCQAAVAYGTHLAGRTHDPRFEATPQIKQWATL